ncbi:DUF3099 domain-containing protein [Bacillus sp. 179-C3.3 HS]|uniref:DUF3099 domain-containing protein n=1 Tax=Bacillus sp. 179-C3.3 HS TaxID=3232162 RepID=UPI0039A35A5A
MRGDAEGVKQDMKTYSIVMIIITLCIILAVFLMNLSGVMYGKVILAVAVALCLTSIIRLMRLRK